MSKEQLVALFAKLKEDAGLREKLKGAAEVDVFVEMAREAGFDVSEADWLESQAQQALELTDWELDRVAGGQQRGDVVQTNFVGPECGTFGNRPLKDDDNRGNSCNPMPKTFS